MPAMSGCAALLATSLGGLTMNETIGAFLFSSALITACGVFGWFDADGVGHGGANRVVEVPWCTGYGFGGGLFAGRPQRGKV